MDENNKWKKWLIIAFGIGCLILLGINMYNAGKTVSKLTYYYYK